MTLTTPERELSLAYAMDKFDTSQGNGRTPERLEAPHHRGASATMNRRVRHDNAALSHHRHEIPITQSVGDVPADAELNDFRIEAATAVNRISGYGLRHFGPRGRPNCTIMPLNATEPAPSQAHRGTILAHSI